MNKKRISLLSLLLIVLLVLTSCASGTTDAPATGSAATAAPAAQGGASAAPADTAGAADATGQQGDGPAFYAVPFADGQVIKIGIYENYLTGYP